MLSLELSHLYNNCLKVLIPEHFVHPRELSANHFTVCRGQTLVLFVCGLAPKCILVLHSHFRKTNAMAIVTTRMRNSHNATVDVLGGTWHYQACRLVRLWLP